MTIAEIHDWLSSTQDYDEGVALLQRFLPGETFLLQLVKNRSSFAEKKMLAALEALAEANPITNAPVEKDAVSSTTQKKVTHTLGQTEGYPDHLKELDRKVLLKIRERDMVRAHLFTVQDDEERYKVARATVLKDQAITADLEQLNYYCRTGQLLPGTEPITEMRKFAQMLLAQKNHPPYISKHKKSTVPAIMAEVKSRRKQLEEVDNFIKAHT